MATKKRVFISFDIDHDDGAKKMLAGQAGNSGDSNRNTTAGRGGPVRFAPDWDIRDQTKNLQWRWCVNSDPLIFAIREIPAGSMLELESRVRVPARVRGTMESEYVGSERTSGVATEEGPGKGDRGSLFTRRICAYSSKRSVASRSCSYRLESGNGGSQDSRRTIQLS